MQPVFHKRYIFFDMTDVSVLHRIMLMASILIALSVELVKSKTV